MDTEKKLQTIEKELRLLKGELKQTLASVRDALLNSSFPPSGSSAAPLKPGNGGGRPVNIKGSFPLPLQDETGAGSKNPPPKEDEAVTAEQSDQAEPLLAIPGLPLEEPPGENTGISRQLDKSVPGVNLLANLISWSAIARREIGDEQLPTLLEVYGITGHLSPEMKDIILNLAEITTGETGENSLAESWSNSILSLHGILNGNDVPLNPEKIRWNEIDSETDTALKNQSPGKAARDIPGKQPAGHGQ